MLQIEAAFLQKVKQTCAGQTLGRRPDEDDRVWRPRLLVFPVAESAMQIEDRFAILPNGNSGAELAEAREIFFEERSEAIPQLVRFKTHSNKCGGTTSASSNEIGTRRSA